MVEVEEERRRAGGLEQRDRVAPVVALGLAEREAVQAAEARHVGGRDHRPAHEVLLVAGELAPERRLEVDVLAHRDRAGVGQRGGARGGRVVEPGEVALAHQHGQVVVAEAGRADAERIARGEHLGALGHRLLVGRAQAAQREVHPLARGLPLRGAKLSLTTISNGSRSSASSRPGRGRVGIVLEAEDRREVGARPSRAAPSRRARSWPGGRAACGRCRSRPSGGAPGASRRCRARESSSSSSLLVVAARALVVAERLRAVVAERGGERLQRGAQARSSWDRPRPARGRACGPQLARALGEAGLAARRAAHERDELVVDEQRAARRASRASGGRCAPPADRRSCASSSTATRRRITWW